MFNFKCYDRRCSFPRASSLWLVPRLTELKSSYQQSSSQHWILPYWNCAADLYNAKHPLSLCTDDSGLFSTSLSNEYYLVATTFGMPSTTSNKDPFLIQTWLTRILLVGLSKSELFQQAQDAAQFVFADDVVKKSLKEVFKHAEKRLLMQDELAAPN